MATAAGSLRPLRQPLSFLSSFFLGCLLLLIIPSSVDAATKLNRLLFPKEINLNAAVLHAPPFATVTEFEDGSLEYGGFQPDLLKRLSIFAAADNVTLNFHLSKSPNQYGAAFDLVADDCPEKVPEDPEAEHQCHQFDMIVGNFYATPDRALRVDLSPAWMRSSISTIKYLEKTGEDYTTLTQASDAGAKVCLKDGTFYAGVVKAKFPKIEFRMCDGQDDCLNALKAEECVLYASDELQLRYRAAWDPTLEVTPESFNTQYIVWPFSNRLDPIVSTLLDRWVLAAVTNATLDELYSDYFQKALCPVGTAGESCELPCDPNTGRADSRGVCVCKSTKWKGDDCSIEVPENTHGIPATLKYLAYGMFGVNCLMIMGCAGWLFWKRQSTQVLVSQPFFLMLVLIGCLISTSTILALGEEDDGDGPVRACMAIPWLYSVGFSVTFGTLFAKIRRVYVIFRSAVDMRRNIVTVQETLIIIGAVLAIDLTILILWTVIDPLEWERTVISADQFGAPLESEGHCTSDHWVIFAGVMAAFHLVLLGVACYCCYVSRGIPTKFSEGKYVSIAMISNLQIFVVGVPILIILGTDSDSSFFVRSVIIWMNDFVVVSLIFGNLIYSVHWDQDETNGQGVKAIAGRAIQQYSQSMKMSSRHLGESCRQLGDSSRRLGDSSVGDRSNSGSIRNLSIRGNMGLMSSNASGRSLENGLDGSGSNHGRQSSASKDPQRKGLRSSLSRGMYEEERIPPMIIEDPTFNRSFTSRGEPMVSQLSASGHFDESDKGKEDAKSQEFCIGEVGDEKSSWGGINLSSMMMSPSDDGGSASLKEVPDEVNERDLERSPFQRRSATKLVPVAEASRETASTDATPSHEYIPSMAESQSTAHSEAEMLDQVAPLPGASLGIMMGESLLTKEPSTPGADESEIVFYQEESDQEDDNFPPLQHLENQAQTPDLDEAESEPDVDPVSAFQTHLSTPPDETEADRLPELRPTSEPARKQGRRRSSLWKNPLLGTPDSHQSTSTVQTDSDSAADSNINPPRKQGRRRSSLWKKPISLSVDTVATAAAAEIDSSFDSSPTPPPSTSRRKQGRRRSSLHALDEGLIDAIRESAANPTKPTTPTPLDNELLEALDGSAQSLTLALTEKSTKGLLRPENDALAFHKKKPSSRRRSSLRAMDDALIVAMADCSANSNPSTSGTFPLDNELAEALEGSSQSLQRALTGAKSPRSPEEDHSENETTADQTSSGFFELDEEDIEANKPKQTSQMRDASDVTLGTSGTGSSTMEIPHGANLVSVGDA